MLKRKLILLAATILALAGLAAPASASSPGTYTSSGWVERTQQGIPASAHCNEHTISGPASSFFHVNVCIINASGSSSWQPAVYFDNIDQGWIVQFDSGFMDVATGGLWSYHYAGCGGNQIELDLAQRFGCFGETLSDTNKNVQSRISGMEYRILQQSGSWGAWTNVPATWLSPTINV